MERKPVILTEDGRRKLQDELEHLRTVRRTEIAELIQHSKELESTANNAGYDQAKNEQAFVEGRIQELEGLLQGASVVRPEHKGTVGIGSTVTLQTGDGDTEVYTIVGSVEASAIEGRISNESPVGQALLGKKVGQQIVVNVPAGKQRLKIMKVL